MHDPTAIAPRPDHQVPTRARMRQLAALTNDMARTVPPQARVGYVDYPMHINVGDLLIFLGTMDFFAANHNLVDTSFCLFDACPNNFARLEECQVIVCHGGGNFGDIYPRHQQLRHRILEAFPHKPVVVMPQSFHFSSPQAMKKSAKIFAAHPDVTIHVRDTPSFDLARNHFSDRVFLSPDMAHRLYDGFQDIRISAAAAGGNAAPLHLMRRDVEAVPAPALRRPEQNVAERDWTDIMRLNEKIRIGRHRTATRLLGLANRADPGQVLAHEKTVRAVIRAIARRIGTANPWHTSRLHGAIMGLLLDRNVFLHDNSYAKNSRYFSQWGPELVSLVT